MKLQTNYPAVVLCILGFIYPLNAGTPNIPERGPQAIESILRSLTTGKSVLTVSLRPGDEDFALQAYLRFAHGTELTSLYITNGEAIPSDCAAETSPFLIGRRKEEADRAMTYLHAKAFFLNNTDPGIVGTRSELDSSWRAYTVRRIAAAIRFLHPHVVIVMDAQKGIGAGGLLHSLIPQLVKEAVGQASKNVAVAGDDGYGSNTGWSVQRICAVANVGSNGIRPDYEAVDPETGITYTNLALTARHSYESLRTSLEDQPSGNSNMYGQFWPNRSSKFGEIDGGINVVSPRFAKLRGFIEGIAKLRPVQKRQLIARCVQGVDSLDRILGTQLGKISELDKYTLLRWKLALERLRFLALDVKLSITVSDSIIAQRQLFYVTVTEYDSSFNKGNTTIYFSPKLPEDWYVNEKQAKPLPLRGPEQFRILSAQRLDVNYPVFRYGLFSPSLGVPFSYGVYHYEENKARRYVANFQVPLRYTRTRIIEIATPIVLWGIDKEIEYRAFNASRDSSRGVFRVYGSNCTSEPETVFVRKKDEMLEGSIKIDWTGEPPKTLDTLEVMTGGRLFGRVFVKHLQVAKDTTRRILLVTPDARGATAAGLRRVYPTASVIAPNRIESFDLDAFDVLLIDRLAIDSQAWADSLSSRLTPWIRRGGNLLMLPQKEGIMFDSTRFRWDVSYAPSADVVLTDGATKMLNAPNRISENNWKEWVYARAWCTIQTDNVSQFDVAISAKRDGRLLLWTKTIGAGTVVYTALNLEQQLANLHDGAFQLFANVLSCKHGGL